MCSKKSIGCRATISTNLEVTQVIRSSERVESCTENIHASYKLKKPDKLKQLVLEDPRPLQQIYNELASNASTSLKTAAWGYVQDTIYTSPARVHC
ncbi:hypothetical protein T10_8864 [Trichinella papuae]|uniref:Uncharacterized protein n=1 Tax=Trichinella papuae TaxID=268474 RepID=A0A0V1M9V3_9BILA|nr:hypothetical protein T10_8864 [Trichinella papuae]